LHEPDDLEPIPFGQKIRSELVTPQDATVALDRHESRILTQVLEEGSDRTILGENPLLAV
jgi:hypothetical protein